MDAAARAKLTELPPATQAALEKTHFYRLSLNVAPPLLPDVRHLIQKIPTQAALEAVTEPNEEALRVLNDAMQCLGQGAVAHLVELSAQTEQRVRRG